MLGWTRDLKLALCREETLERVLNLPIFVERMSVITAVVVLMRDAVSELELHEEEDRLTQSVTIREIFWDEVGDSNREVNDEVDHLEAFGAVRVHRSTALGERLERCGELGERGVTREGRLKVEEVIPRLSRDHIVKGEEILSEVEEHLKEVVQVFGNKAKTDTIMHLRGEAVRAAEELGDDRAVCLSAPFKLHDRDPRLA